MVPCGLLTWQDEQSHPTSALERDTFVPRTAMITAARNNRGTPPFMMIADRPLPAFLLSAAFSISGDMSELPPRSVPAFDTIKAVRLSDSRTMRQRVSQTKLDHVNRGWLIGLILFRGKDSVLERKPGEMNQGC